MAARIQLPRNRRWLELLLSPRTVVERILTDVSLKQKLSISVTPLMLQRARAHTHAALANAPIFSDRNRVVPGLPPTVRTGRRNRTRSKKTKGKAGRSERKLERYEITRDSSCFRADKVQRLVNTRKELCSRTVSRENIYSSRGISLARRASRGGGCCREAETSISGSSQFSKLFFPSPTLARAAASLFF